MCIEYFKIPSSKPFITGKELEYINEAISLNHISGDGIFTQKCSEFLEKNTKCMRALLTHSGTAALEMCAILLDIQQGDEIIMPSYTFVTTANAFVTRGGVPVFVDIREDTLNIDESLIEQAITPRTKAVVVVHYAGVACEMDAILDIAARHGLAVVEDAAQGIHASYKGRALGSLGTLGALSFHETKNITSGEGGAILINDRRYIKRAEIIREKGTNRKAFLNGEVDKYTWVDVGSSFLPGELAAAFLWAQMEQAANIQQKRLALWKMYHEALFPYEQAGLLRRPIIPAGCEHNAHLYYILLPTRNERDRVLSELKKCGIMALFHYIPLHSSPAGKKFARSASAMSVTEDCAGRLIRLPLFCDLGEESIRFIVRQLGTIMHFR